MLVRVAKQKRPDWECVVHDSVLDEQRAVVRSEEAGLRRQPSSVANRMHACRQTLPKLTMRQRSVVEERIETLLRVRFPMEARVTIESSLLVGHGGLGSLAPRNGYCCFAT